MKRAATCLFAALALGGLPDFAQSASPDAAQPAVTLGAVPGDGLTTTRGYADSALGQVHWQLVQPERPARASGPVFVLLHQVPWFHIYYTRAQAELAARGQRSIAIDLPGYGLSSRPTNPPKIADYADAVAATLRDRRITRAIIVGHHTGATVGADLARRHPRTARCLVLHGVPLYTPEQAAARLASPHWDQTYRDDAAHLTERWTYLSGRVVGSTESLHWSVLSMYLAGSQEWFGHHAVFRYDMSSTLLALRQPVTVLSNPQDLLHFTLARVRELRPDFSYEELDGSSSNMAFDEPARWIDAVTRASSRCAGQ
ncbi:MAG: alpha/beta fold hydrolase [Steroidobacteraceae bacterium]